VVVEFDMMKGVERMVGEVIVFWGCVSGREKRREEAKESCECAENVLVR